LRIHETRVPSTLWLGSVSASLREPQAPWLRVKSELSQLGRPTPNTEYLLYQPRMLSPGALPYQPGLEGPLSDGALVEVLDSPQPGRSCFGLLRKAGLKLYPPLRHLG
jgi:hypothetical protein